MTGNSQQEDFPEIVSQQCEQYHVDAEQAAPDDNSDQCLIPAEIMPGRAQTQKDDGIGGDRDEEQQAAVTLQEIERRQDDKGL